MNKEHMRIWKSGSKVSMRRLRKKKRSWKEGLLARQRSSSSPFCDVVLCVRKSRAEQINAEKSNKTDIMWHLHTKYVRPVVRGIT